MKFSGICYFWLRYAARKPVSPAAISKQPKKYHMPFGMGWLAKLNKALKRIINAPLKAIIDGTHLGEMSSIITSPSPN